MPPIRRRSWYAIVSDGVLDHVLNQRFVQMMAAALRAVSQELRAMLRIDAPRRASVQAARWSKLAETKKNLQAVSQKYDKLVESTAKRSSEKTATAR